MTTADEIALAACIVAGVGVLVNIAAVAIVYLQLTRMAESNKTASLQLARMAESNQTANAMAVLSLEQSIAGARAGLAGVAAEIHERAKDPKNDLRTEQLRLDESLEQYLNFMDRLCSYIIRGYIDEETYRKDYRQWVVETVATYKQKFAADTRHRNILAVYQAWADDKPARLAA